MRFQVNNFGITKIKSLTNGFLLLSREVSEPLFAIGIDMTSLIIEATEKTCMKGQLVSLEGFLNLEGEVFPFYTSGKVTEVIPLEQYYCQYVIQMYQYDRRDWEKLIKKIASEQNSVDSLFGSLRGDL